MRSEDIASWLNGSSQDWVGSPAFDSLIAKVLAVILVLIAAGLAYGFLDSELKNRWLAAGAGVVAAMAVVAWLSGGPASAEAHRQGVERDQENRQTVRTWVGTYGAEIVDEEAGRMGSDIALGRSGDTYLLQGPDGVIEVSLSESADGEFYLMHGASELDLAGPDTGT